MVFLRKNDTFCEIKGMYRQALILQFSIFNP